MSVSLLPEAEEGLFTLNVAKAVDITIAPELSSIESFRHQSSQSELEGLSQLDVTHLVSVSLFNRWTHCELGNGLVDT